MPTEYRFLRRFISLFVTLLLIFSAVFPYMVSAENVKKTVRIGWYQSDLFQEGTADGEAKSGYSYEYIHKISNYNGWEYEYVYGEWTELFAMLRDGDIDILAGVSKTEERMEYLLYPNEIMGNEHYVLYQHSDNRQMSSSDLSTFKGKKIGAITNNLMTVELEKWLEEKNAEAEIVYYDGFEERDNDFEGGVIDAIVTTDNGVLLSSGYDQIARVGEEAYYLAVSAKREDLLDDLNRAQGFIQEIDPYFLTNLEYKCYGTTLANSTLSDPEEEWVAAHNSIIVGYLDNYLPYSASDEEGKVTGLVTDVMAAILSELNINDRISVEYKAFASGEEMNAAIISGEIDTAFPVGGELNQLEEEGIKATNDLVTSKLDLIFKGGLSESDINKVAVNKGNIMMKNYLLNEFPDAEIVEFDGINSCLDAVKSGKADATVINGLRIDLVKQNRKYDSLSTKTLRQTSGRCLGVAVENTGLLMLLNRGIKLIGQDFATNASYQYMSGLYKETYLDFISDHLPVFIIIVLAVIFTILGIGTAFLKRTRRYLKLEEEKNSELAEKQLKLEEAALERQKQFDEITLLNNELEERQAQLEENSAEQQAQIEEIHALNDDLILLREEADRANESKTIFLNNMSHDIRTPMNAILGFSELMRNKTDNPAVISDYLDKIKLSGEYLLTIINNVLDMAKIESGKATVNEAVIDLIDEGKNIYTTVEQTAKNKNQTISLTSDIKHRYVMADLSKTREIYMNLISNAIKYTQEGGKISVDLTESASDKEGYAKYCLTVEDNGIGMTKEFQETIFDSFTRERDTTESKIFGTGLGMSIVKKLVDLMEGTIELESAPGEGSTFKVYLEHKTVDNPEEFADKESECGIDESMLSGKKFLVAEDNDLNAEIIETVLDNIGISSVRAKDGNECIKILCDNPSDEFDMILMDIQMPNKNGYDSARSIRELDDMTKANIPIIAMTANAFDEDRKKCFDSGMNGHIAKPIEIKKLINTISAVLSENDKT